MLGEVDELVGQVVKAIPDCKRQEVKFSHSEINKRPKMSLNMAISRIFTTAICISDFILEKIQ